MFRKLFLGGILFLWQSHIYAVLPTNVSQIRVYHCVFAFLGQKLNLSPHWWPKDKIRKNLPSWHEAQKVFDYIQMLNSVDGYESVGEVWRYRFGKSTSDELAFTPWQIVQQGLHTLLLAEGRSKRTLFTGAVLSLLSDKNPDFPFLFLNFYYHKTYHGDKIFIESVNPDKILIAFMRHLKSRQKEIATDMHMAHLIVKVLDRIEKINRLDVSLSHGMNLVTTAIDYYSYRKDKQIVEIFEQYKYRIWSNYIQTQSD